MLLHSTVFRIRKISRRASRDRSLRGAGGATRGSTGMETTCTNCSLGGAARSPVGENHEPGLVPWAVGPDPHRPARGRPGRLVHLSNTPSLLQRARLASGDTLAQLRALCPLPLNQSRNWAKKREARSIQFPGLRVWCSSPPHTLIHLTTGFHFIKPFFKVTMCEGTLRSGEKGRENGKPLVCWPKRSYLG